MSAGFIVTQGADNEDLPPGIRELVKEIRVEQKLSDPTKYAIRFEQDICDGEAGALTATTIRAGAMLSVLVRANETDTDLECLVRGPVSKIKCSAVLGGPGSWLEVHGEDRRIEMDREDVQATWTGNAIDIAASIIDRYGFDIVLGTGQDIVYEGNRQLNQSSKDLAQVHQLARQLGFEFWISYELQDGRRIVETANFRKSPDMSGAGLDALPGISLLDDDREIALKLNVPNRECRNITAFNLEIDLEHATAALIEGIDGDSGENDEVEAEPENTPVDDAAEDYDPLPGVTRTIGEPGAGSAEEQAPEIEAALEDESWFVTATASTSVHLLDKVVYPHDIISVEGTGFAHGGKYHVSEVTHVINNWGHLMDLKLRRNALRQGAGGAA